LRVGYALDLQHVNSTVLNRNVLFTEIYCTYANTVSTTYSIQYLLNYALCLKLTCTVKFHV